jgi:hypothetical protein
LVLRYFLRILTVFVLVIVVASVVLTLLASFLPAIPLIVASIVPIYALLLVLGIGLPATALGNQAPTFRQSLQIVQGNVGAIVLFALFSLALVLVTTFVAILVASLFVALFSDVGRIAIPLITLPFNLFVTLFSISAITTLYGYFFEGREFRQPG